MSPLLPAMWIFGGIALDNSTVDNGAVILAIWIVWGIAGLLGGARIASRAALDRPSATTPAA